MMALCFVLFAAVMLLLPCREAQAAEGSVVLEENGKGTWSDSDTDRKAHWCKVELKKDSRLKVEAQWTYDAERFNSGHHWYLLGENRADCLSGYGDYMYLPEGTYWIYVPYEPGYLSTDYGYFYHWTFTLEAKTVPAALLPLSTNQGGASALALGKTMRFVFEAPLEGTASIDNASGTLTLNDSGSTHNLDYPCMGRRLKVTIPKAGDYTYTYYLEGTEGRLPNDVGTSSALAIKSAEGGTVAFVYPGYSYTKEGETASRSKTGTVRFEKAGTYYLEFSNYNYCAYDVINFGLAGDSSADPLPVKVTSVKITGKTSVKVGKKITLTASVSPSDAANKAVSWSSSNKKYATVSSKGVVTAKTAGAGKTVTITAKAKDGSGKKATFKVKIKAAAVKVASVKITGRTSVKAGKKITLKASVSPANAANKAVSWSSSNKKYATVSSKGVVKALKAGKGKTVKITAKAKDGSGKKASIRIKIK